MDSAAFRSFIISSIVKFSFQISQAASPVFYSIRSLLKFLVILSDKVGKTAAEINQLSSEEFRAVMDECLFKQYQIGIENKNLRLIARSFLNQSDK